MKESKNGIRYTIEIVYNNRKKVYEIYSKEPGFDPKDHSMLTMLLSDINKLRYSNTGCFAWGKKQTVKQIDVAKVLVKNSEKCWLHYKLINISTVKDGKIKFKDLRILCIRQSLKLLLSQPKANKDTSVISYDKVKEQLVNEN